MRKITIIAVSALLAAGIACAEDLPTEQDYRNLDELRSKLVRMRREMDRFMKDVINTYPDQDNAFTSAFGQDVKIDIAQTDKEMLVKADLPGMDKDKISVTLESGKILKIAGSREVVKKEASPGIVRQERTSGRFERILELPSEGTNEGIKAAYKNGVLDIVIPKKARSKEDSVTIKVQ